MVAVPVPGEPALHLPDEKMLVVADLHYGVEAELLRGGVWVPNRARQRTERLLALVAQTGAERLLLLGDVKHQVPHSSHQQRRDLRRMFATLGEAVQIEVVPGNHDGGLRELAPGSVRFHPVQGVVVGDVGLHHGHAWPAPEVVACRQVVAGHNHPAIAFRDRVEKLHTAPCWLRVPLLAGERYDVIGKELIIIPAFGELAGRTMNREPLAGFGPLLRNGYGDLPAGRVESLDGLDFGELRHLMDLRLER